ncbi:MAG: 4Fe-4S binding protein [Dehalococcoidales bacterium]|nr:MAG: 4Fe-4S binding protein [Dehalococcoidales bacterium]
MGIEEKIYKDLRKHLNKQAVGYPSTLSGVEIKLLKRFFTPEEAKLAMYLTYKPAALETILESANEMRKPNNEIGDMLNEMTKNGVIGQREKDGIHYYYNLPLAVGMYEGQVNRLTPEFLKDFDKYSDGKIFGLEFISTELPQMRTIPVKESIPLDYHVMNYDHITDIINDTQGPIAVLECICRQRKSVLGDPCHQTKHMETCIQFGDAAKNVMKFNAGREISKEEALNIIQKCESDGLILQPSNSQEVEFVCACCGCCCGLMSVHKMLPKPAEFWATNHYASVNSELCTECGTCVDRCQVNAIKLDEHLHSSIINLDRCIGCGNCISKCPSEAIKLNKKDKEIIPPEDMENLYDIIMANKKGVFGKMKLAARIMLKR